MAAKLYPPSIEGTIPAWTGTKLVVPFSMNRTVSQNDVSGMTLRIKNVYNDNLIQSYSINKEDIDFNFPCKANFNLSKEGFTIGQYYKIQIAYRGNDNIVGHYSTVGVAKYTTKPEVTIEDLKIDKFNIHKYEYIGKYKQVKNLNDPTSIADFTEKVYSYHFNLYDENNQIIDTSGERLHISEFDKTEEKRDENKIMFESSDLYTINQDLEFGKSYYIEYVITTTNKMVITSGKYELLQEQSINSTDFKGKIVPTVNFENGYIDVGFVGDINPVDNNEFLVNGLFKLFRSDSSSNYSSWNELTNFHFKGEMLSKFHWKDFTIQQGVTYQYAIAQFNNYGLISNKIKSDLIFADFDHAFLYDGFRQLKIKYNPQINNFKNNILEAKIDTIGGKYPFIFRNGSVKYKEFSISGLISYHSDEELLFCNESEEEFCTSLTGENIFAERKFKLSVLEWLNNGQPKLFKSPTEGNYIIRLLNVSLTPNEQTGRMLHTFNSTAYEVLDYNYQNLRDLGYVPLGVETDTKALYFRTENQFSMINKDIEIVNSIYFDGLGLGQEINIKGTKYKSENGTCFISLPFSSIKISDIEISGDVKDLMITYGYYDKPILTEFDRKKSVSFDKKQYHSNHQLYNAKEIDLLNELLNFEDMSGNFTYNIPIFYNIKCELKDNTKDGWLNINDNLITVNSNGYEVKNITNIKKMSMNDNIIITLSYLIQKIEVIL